MTRRTRRSRCADSCGGTGCGGALKPSKRFNLLFVRKGAAVNYQWDFLMRESWQGLDHAEARALRGVERSAAAASGFAG